MNLARIVNPEHEYRRPHSFSSQVSPKSPALCVLGKDIVSYARLGAQMNNVARRAIACGLKRGSNVAVATDQPLLEAILILGLTAAGLVPVSASMAKPPAGLKIDAVIGATNVPPAPAIQHLPLDYSWFMGDGAPVETARDTLSESDEICRIILTSGTTGDPKAVALTHKLVMARNARFEYLLGARIPTSSRIYMDTPGFATSLGYCFLPYVLGRGGTIFLSGERIENTLRLIEIFRIPGHAGDTNVLAQWLTIYDQHPSIDVQFDTIVSGGSALTRSLIERIRPRLCSHLVTGYGATETGMSAAAPAHRIAHIEGAVGYVTPGARIEIVDDVDRPVPAGTEGIVRVASEWAVDRYIGDPIGSAQAFRNRWFYPGDLGSLTSDDVLIISGRRSDVLNIGGAKSPPKRSRPC